MVCARCGTSFAGNFCPSCGWPAGTPLPPPPSGIRTILGVLWLFALFLFIVYLAVILAALVFVSPGIIAGSLTSTCSECTAFFLWINPLSPTFFGFAEVGGVGLLAWFFIVLAVIFGIYLYLFLFHGRRTYRVLRLPPEHIARKFGSRSPVLAVGQLYMALLFFVFVYWTFILPYGFGIKPGAPAGFDQLEEWYRLFIAVSAAVWEELAFRLLLIGVPMALGSLVMRLPQALSESPANNPSRARYVAGSIKYLFGGQVREGSPRGAIYLGAALLLLSSAIFGFIHIPGWGEWRFVDASIAGLALGYLFLRHGIWAAILLHFSVNSSLVLVTATSAQTALGAALVLGTFFLLLEVFGAGFFAYYVKRTGRFLLRPLLGPARRPAPAPQPREPPANPTRDLLLFPVTCPQCGGHEAQYQEGALLCSRCGTRLSAARSERGRGQLLD